jgi:wyosine [tRNA(Phe)-imidazoG37] synthetase (radical SAM superfamily)
MTQPLALFHRLRQVAEQQDWRYIYPVWSRRAQGLSIGINLHPNHCCNWHCIYCQVPGLQRGASPEIDMPRLQDELTACLDWLTEHLPAASLTMSDYVQDIAFAGDGEPTTSPQFSAALSCVQQLLSQKPETDRPARVRLITNGSQMHLATTQQAMHVLQQMEGEVWFKLDAGNDAEMLTVNDARLPLSLHLQRLKACSQLCPTWVQTAVMQRRVENKLVTTPSLDGYIEALQPFKESIAGILLYGIARASQQDTQASIQAPDLSLLEQYAAALQAHGFNVRVFA